MRKGLVQLENEALLVSTEEELVDLWMEQRDKHPTCRETTIIESTIEDHKIIEERVSYVIFALSDPELFDQEKEGRVSVEVVAKYLWRASEEEEADDVSPLRYSKYLYVVQRDDEGDFELSDWTEEGAVSVGGSSLFVRPWRET